MSECRIKMVGTRTQPVAEFFREDGPQPVIVMGQVVERKGGMRLNTEMKEQVVKKALSHAFDKRQATALKEEHALSRLFWLKAFGSRALAAAKVLGEPFVFVCKDNYNKARPEGVSVTWNVGGQHVALRSTMPLPTILTHGHRDKNLVIKDELLVNRCRNWQNDSEMLRTEYQKVQGTLIGMLQNISTYKSLETNWPEGKPFYKHLPAAFPHRHQVPAVLVNELNKALGL